MAQLFEKWEGRMTAAEQEHRDVLIDYLRDKGYATYADLLLNHFVFRFHRPDYPFAAMVDSSVKPPIIYLNPDITSKKDASLIIRHEILHWYLEHQERALEYYAQQRGLEWEELADIPLEDLVNMDANDFAKLADSLGDKKDVANRDREIARGLYGRTYDGIPYHNLIKDLEISNRGYTEADKQVVKNLTIDGVPFPGLVTELDYPDWVGMDIEDMMDAVEDELEREKEAAEKLKNYVFGSFDPNKGVFIDDEHGVIYGDF